MSGDSLDETKEYARATPPSPHEAIDGEALGRGRGGRGRGGRGRGGRGRGGRGRGGRGRGGRVAGHDEPDVPQAPDLGRRRGRGRGRPGRGQVNRRLRLRVLQPDAERVRRMQNDRTEGLKLLVNEMSLEELRAMMVQVLLRQPGFIFDIIEMAKARPHNSDLPPEPRSSSTPSWCSCNHCEEMPTDLERLCCGQTPQKCISLRIEMEWLVLDPQVINVANHHRAEMLAAAYDATNKGMRHGSYRQFVLWRHGRLGQGVRRVIPSCCVLRVRRLYPEPSGVYTGFIPSRLA